MTILGEAILLFVSYVVNLYKYIDFIQQKMLALNKIIVNTCNIHKKEDEYEKKLHIDNFNIIIGTFA